MPLTRWLRAGEDLFRRPEAWRAVDGITPGLLRKYPDAECSWPWRYVFPATRRFVGFDAWLRARVGFGARPRHRILPSRDMLIPIAIFAQADSTQESRTGHYLLAGFNAAYDGNLVKLAAWQEWTTAIAALEPATRGAFEGTVNLHGHADDIAKALACKKL